MDLKNIRDTLEKAKITFAAGLTDNEVRQAETAYGFTFPPDSREFLAFALPISVGWPNWRELDNPAIKKMFEWPYKGICFDIEKNSFWLKEWGQKPASLMDAFTMARKKVSEAPKLIPVSGHRYMPDKPSTAGNPVFSVYQTDIIYYGSDLLNYFENEFYSYFQTPQYKLKEPIRKIEFWSMMVDLR